MLVSAGDLIGASPLVSALFHDEGTIEAMNRIGLDFDALGNHEFDEGRNELLRMQSGGCHLTDVDRSCRGAEVGAPVPFEGARFRFLGANVVERSTGRTPFAPYGIKQFGNVRVGFIGMTLEGTPAIVTPSGVAGLQFRDEADTANALVRTLRARGVETIVVLIHEGGTVPVAQNGANMNRCDGGLAGSAIREIVSRLDDEVDLVISGHTHQAYNCALPNSSGRLISVTSANAQGRILTDIKLIVDGVTKDVRSVVASNFIVTRSGVTPNAAIRTLVDNYSRISAPIANRVIGSIGGTLPNTANAAGENPMGDVIADAQLDATDAAGFGNAVAAFMNPGGVRAGLNFASSTVGEGDGQVTYGESFTVQPFGNSLVTLTITGAQLKLMLEQQFRGCLDGYPPGATGSTTGGQPFNRVLLPSASVSYAWSASAAACAKVSNLQIAGVPVNPSADYRVTVNSFLADGGDQFYVLAQGTNRLGGAQDLDALENYLRAQGTVQVPALNRITLLP